MSYGYDFYRDKEKGWIGTAYVARFDFNTKKDEEILVTTGISGVSMEGAGKNLRAEAPKDDFDYYQAQASANWNRQLSKIEVKSRNTDDMVKFYTALYHSMIAPTIYSDVDGSYYGPDQQIHKRTDGRITLLSLYGIPTVPPIRCLRIRSRNGRMI